MSARRRWVGAPFLLLVVLGGSAWAFSDFQVTCEDNVDCSASFVDPAGNAVTNADLSLYRDQDSDGDGRLDDDFVLLINNVNVANVNFCDVNGVRTILACYFTGQGAGQEARFVFKNASTEHRPANYSLRVTWRNAINQVVTYTVGSFRVVASSADDVAQHEQTRALLNTTGDGLELAVDDHDLNMTQMDSIVVDDNEDVMVATRDRVGSVVTASDVVVSLIGRSDLNSDGDWTDAGETTTIISTTTSAATCVAAALNPHFSCNLQPANEQADITWRNTSSSHVPGNYSLRLTWRSSSTESLRVDTWAVRITEAASAQHVGTRDLVNSTRTILVGEHQGTRLLINATNCLQNNCTTGNATVNQTQLKALGINLSDLVVGDITVANLLVVLLWLAAFIWCAREQWVLPATIALIGIFLQIFTGGITFSTKLAFILWIVFLVFQWAIDRFKLGRKDSNTVVGKS